MSEIATRARRLAGHAAVSLRSHRWAKVGAWSAVLFHHITDEARWTSTDPFVSGLGVDMSLDDFDACMDTVLARYDVVALSDVLEARDPPGASRRPKRRVVVCFDDAYASVAQLAAPVLAARGVPWTLFLNPGFVGNRTLALDNLVAYVFNRHGTAPLSRAFGQPVSTLPHVLSGLLPDQSPAQRRSLVESLAADVGADVSDLARDAGLYLSAEEVRALADSGVEIGNHTADHVHCRNLDRASAAEQLVDSREAVGALTGRPVRDFAYPYGSFDDVTQLSTKTLRDSGHRSAFVVGGRGNDLRTDRYALHRVALSRADPAGMALELDVFPAVRHLRSAARRRATGS